MSKIGIAGLYGNSAFSFLGTSAPFSTGALPTNSIAFIACGLLNGGHHEGSIWTADLRVLRGWDTVIMPCAVQWPSRVWLFATPCTAARQASLTSTVSQFAQIHVHRVGDAIQPAHPLLYLLRQTSPPLCVVPFLIRIANADKALC